VRLEYVSRFKGLVSFYQCNLSGNIQILVPFGDLISGVQATSMVVDESGSGISGHIRMSEMVHAKKTLVVAHKCLRLLVLSYDARQCNFANDNKMHAKPEWAVRVRTCGAQAHGTMSDIILLFRLSRDLEAWLFAAQAHEELQYASCSLHGCQLDCCSCFHLLKTGRRHGGKVEPSKVLKLYQEARRILREAKNKKVGKVQKSPKKSLKTIFLSIDQKFVVSNSALKES